MPPGKGIFHLRWCVPHVAMQYQTLTFHNHMHASIEWIYRIIRTLTTVTLLSRIHKAKNIYSSNVEAHGVCVDFCEKPGTATMNESRASWPASSPASWTQQTLPGTWQSYAGALESIIQAPIIFLIIIIEHHIWFIKIRMQIILLSSDIRFWTLKLFGI